MPMLTKYDGSLFPAARKVFPQKNSQVYPLDFP